MKNTAVALASMLLVLTACTTKPTQSPYTAKTTAGWVKGAPNADASVTIYKGIPFAAPPVGELRWKAPQPVNAWTDTLQCLKFGASPVQNKPVPFLMWSQEFITPAEPISEDCLFLNVWTPKHEPEQKLPVLVWIYGGGFVSGSAACPVYDGETFAKEGIVFVSLNYRVGIFGFMAHPDLTAESPNHASGNYALLDQVAALQWVHDNIAAFGGDPSKVTIMGQSAGSMAVQSLVASPLTKGLISGAIAQSGGMSSARQIRSLADAEKIGQDLSNDIASLRALPADSVLARASKLPFGTFSPIVDGYFFTEDPRAIFAEGRQNQVPVMTGWVTGDADLVMRQGGTPKERTTALLQFAGVPGVIWAAANKNNTYIYQFSYVPTDKPGFPNYGAFHTADVPFALHNLDMWDRPWTEADRQVENYMSSYWINFVKTGDPNGTGLTQWPAYEKNTGNIIDLGAKAEVKPGLYKEELNLLQN